MTERTHVAIIGGGITGLALARHLQAEGVPHIVLEAESRPGGVIRSGLVDGHLLEWGPQRTRLTAGVRQLIDDLGLADEVVTARPGLPLFVYRSGKLRRVPFSAWEFAKSDIASLSGKLPLLREPFTKGADPNETVANFFVRKIGRELYENLVGPLYGGLYASDPADMVVGLSLGHVLREFGIGRSLLMPLLRRGGSIEPPVASSFRQGMESIPLALHRVNASNVRLSTPVRSISPGKRWSLETAHGEIEADRLVITTPAPAAARLLGSIDRGSAEALLRLKYNPLAVVHLHADTTLEGLGYQVSLAESLATRGVTFNSSLFGRTGVYTAYLGGAKAPHVVGKPDAEIASLAVKEFQQVTGLVANSVSVAREAMPAWDATWSNLAELRLPAGITIAANWESRPGIPGRLAQARRLSTEIVAAYRAG